MIRLLLVLSLLAVLGLGTADCATAATGSASDRPATTVCPDQPAPPSHPDSTLGLSPSEDDEAVPPAGGLRDSGGQSSAANRSPASAGAASGGGRQTGRFGRWRIGCRHADGRSRGARAGSPFAVVAMQDAGPGNNGGGSAEPAYQVPEVENLPTKEPGEKWTIPQPTVFKTLGITLYGWLDQGATLNTLSPRDRWNGPVDLNDRSNEYELNQFWVGVERKVKTDGCGFDIGGRIDVMYGTDWRYGDCAGLEQNYDAQNQLYGLVLPQFYAEVGYNDLTVKIGHYAALMGYELVARRATSSIPIPTPCPIPRSS